MKTFQPLQQFGGPAMRDGFRRLLMRLPTTHSNIENPEKVGDSVSERRLEHLSQKLDLSEQRDAWRLVDISQERPRIRKTRSPV
jgi:hypothetical protein